MTDKLKPCLFCKQDSVYIHHQLDGKKSWKVICHCCLAETPMLTKAKAIAAWNKRQGENDEK